MKSICTKYLNNTCLKNMIRDEVWCFPLSFLYWVVYFSHPLQNVPIQHHHFASRISLDSLSHLGSSLQLPDRPVLWGIPIVLLYTKELKLFQDFSLIANCPLVLAFLGLNVSNLVVYKVPISNKHPEQLEDQIKFQ